MLFGEAERPILKICNYEKTEHPRGDPHSLDQHAFTEDMLVPGIGLAAGFTEKNVGTKVWCSSSQHWLLIGITWDVI